MMIQPSIRKPAPAISPLRERLRLVVNRLPFWAVILSIVLGGGLLMVVLNWFFPSLGGERQFPYAMRSPFNADYSGERPAVFAPVNLGVLAEALFDQNPRARQNQQNMLNELKTPVPSITPLNGAIGMPVAPSRTAQVVLVVETATKMPTARPTFTATPLPPTPTGTPPGGSPVASTATSGANPGMNRTATQTAVRTPDSPAPTIQASQEPTAGNPPPTAQPPPTELPPPTQPPPPTELPPAATSYPGPDPGPTAYPFPP